jgi:hypothetical protein
MCVHPVVLSAAKHTYTCSAGQHICSASRATTPAPSENWRERSGQTWGKTRERRAFFAAISNANMQSTCKIVSPLLVEMMGRNPAWHSTEIKKEEICALFKLLAKFYDSQDI